ncbi:MAG: hypothetical protein EBZ48_03995 [Proteobacteria bacterium]|nr:hypothetical protein [Pseudomonadota bacterium]
MKFNIPLWVKSTFTSAIGTEIVTVPEGEERPMTGVTHTGKLVYLEFDLTAVPDLHRMSLESRVCDMLAKYSLNLYMITLGSNGIGFAVSRDQYPTVKDLLDGLVVPLTDEPRRVGVHLPDARRPPRRGG